MDKEKLLKILDKFKEKKIIVIGDIMLDKYIIGDVERISPEAPVQVVKVTTEGFAPGGASNVASNISSLGAKSYMVGLVGSDRAKDILINEFKKRNIDSEGMIEIPSRPTIQKVRVIARSQQLLRFDYEKTDYEDEDTTKRILKFIKDHIDNTDAIVISDYAKGVITRKLMEELVKIAKEKDKIIVVDPKPKHTSFYKGVTIITPNHKEASEMTHIEDGSEESIHEMGNKLMNDLGSEVIITRGEKGMSIFEKNNEVTNIPTKAKEVYDVTGAGDTVAATIALALASGATTRQAAIIANHAAGITVGKIGTSAVSIEELKESIEKEE